MSRMFGFVSETWNPIVGCLHNCYNGRCWARMMAKRQKHRCQLCYEFKPHIHFDRLKPFNVSKPKTIFVCSMSDLFGWFIPGRWIMYVLDVCHKSKGPITWFFETKNPARYVSYIDIMPENIILSTTIETNLDIPVSKAPPTYERYMVMRKIKGCKKHVSIEPIIDFNLEVMVNWIRDIEPVKVTIGFDNYNANLPEPPLEKVIKLKRKLEDFTEVECKKSKKYGEWWKK